MTQDQIKQTWKSLLIPFIAGVIILLAGILWSQLGSHASNGPVYGIYVSLFGAVLSIATGSKILKFRKYLKENNL